jgi:Asp-tRNA(Asn)/Glu-tRNA(Gln) amidotransferase A subunit family amidase
LQLVGRAFDEATLFRVGAALEDAGVGVGRELGQ